MMSKDTKKYFSFYFNEGYGAKIGNEFISLGIQIPSAKHHSCGTISCFQIRRWRMVSFLRTHGLNAVVSEFSVVTWLIM